MNATSKLAQAAKGSKVCTGCGRTKVLAKFPIHPRWHRPMNICDECMTERRKAGAQKRVAKQAQAKQKQVRQAERQVQREAKQSGEVAVLWAKLDGFAIAMENEALTALIAELKEATSHG